MAEQTIELEAAWYRVNDKRWFPPTGSRPEIVAGLRIGAFARFFAHFYFNSVPEGSITLRFASNQEEFSAEAGDDLTLEFEQNGSLELIVGSNSLLVTLDSADMVEPYDWTPSNSAEVIAFEALLSDVAGTESGQLIIRDFVPTVDHAVDAGDAAFAFAVPEPTVTHTPATVAALVLSDFVLADGLEAEVLGLIEAAAPIDVFSRSPRPARGTLVDGELDLSGDSEPVTRFRFRAQATNTAGGARITLNDSGTLSLADFFGSGGGGADLTVWVQTSAGVISFASSVRLPTAPKVATILLRGECRQTINF